MTDVRLTATNPDDSSVVPVACNAKGELLLEELTLPADDFVAKTGDNMTGNLTLGTDKITLSADGSATFAGNLIGSSLVGTQVENNDYGLFVNSTDISIGTTTFGVFGDGSVALGIDPSSNAIGNTRLFSNGSAEFGGDVVVGSRSKKWMLVEQGGLCHMVEQARATTADLANPATEYPPLRDVFSELNAIEAALAEVMEKLRMKPPAGWEVWDGSSKNS